jgi:hypothetical protein
MFAVSSLVVPSYKLDVPDSEKHKVKPIALNAKARL